MLEFKEEVTRKLQDTNKKILNLGRLTKLLTKKIEYKEKQQRKSKVLIFGLREEHNEDIYAFFMDKLKIANINVQELSCAYRIEKNNEQKLRPILMKLLVIHKKAEIVRKYLK